MHVQGMNEKLEVELRRIARSVCIDGDLVCAGIESQDDAAALAEAVVRGGGRLLMMIPERESLEEMFVRVIEKEERARC